MQSQYFESLVVMIFLCNQPIERCEHRLRVGNVFKNESPLLAGSLDMQVPVLQEVRHDAVGLNRHILNAFNPVHRDDAREYTALVNVNNATIRDDPQIQMLINPRIKKEEEQEKVVGA